LSAAGLARPGLGERRAIDTSGVATILIGHRAADIERQKLSLAA